jgi:hypothetical protein
MENSIDSPIVLEEYPATRPSLRIAVVTETWPPEVNGVAMTLAKLVQGLSHRNHDVQLIRPRQTKTDSPMSDSSLEEVLMRGMPIPTTHVSCVTSNRTLYMYLQMVALLNKVDQS